MRVSAVLLIGTLVSMVVAANAAAPAATPAATGLQVQSTAKIFDLNDRTKHLYNFKNEIEITGDTKKMVATYTGLDGNVLVHETTIVRIAEGKESLVSYDLDHRQMGAKGKIEVREGKADFTYTKDGETKTASENVGDDFVISTMIVGFLGRNWEKIKKGEKLEVRLGVVDRRETVGFSYKKEAESADSVKVKMRPSSLIIAAIVNPLIWTMEPNGTFLKELEGRSPVKTVKGEKFKDFDGYTVYTQGAPKTQ